MRDKKFQTMICLQMDNNITINLHCHLFIKKDFIMDICEFFFACKQRLQNLNLLSMQCAHTINVLLFLAQNTRIIVQPKIMHHLSIVFLYVVFCFSNVTAFFITYHAYNYQQSHCIYMVKYHRKVLDISALNL